jgi:hypothetical protein
MKTLYDPNNGDEARFYYARYERELNTFVHRTNISLLEYDFDEKEDNEKLCRRLRHLISPVSLNVDEDGVELGPEKFYFYIPTGKIRERLDGGGYIEHILEPDAEKESIRAVYSQHMTDLGVIINNVEGSALAQTQAAVKTLAQGQEKILKLIKEVLT